MSQTDPPFTNAVLDDVSVIDSAAMEFSSLGVASSVVVSNMQSEMTVVPASEEAKRANVSVNDSSQLVSVPVPAPAPMNDVCSSSQLSSLEDMLKSAGQSSSLEAFVVSDDVEASILSNVVEASILSVVDSCSEAMKFPSRGVRASHAETKESVVSNLESHDDDKNMKVFPDMPPEARRVLAPANDSSQLVSPEKPSDVADETVVYSSRMKYVDVWSDLSDNSRLRFPGESSSTVIPDMPLAASEARCVLAPADVPALTPMNDVCSSSQLSSVEGMTTSVLKSAGQSSSLEASVSVVSDEVEVGGKSVVPNVQSYDVDDENMKVVPDMPPEARRVLSPVNVSEDDDLFELFSAAKPSDVADETDSSSDVCSDLSDSTRYFTITTGLRSAGEPSSTVVPDMPPAESEARRVLVPANVSEDNSQLVFVPAPASMNNVCSSSQLSSIERMTMPPPMLKPAGESSSLDVPAPVRPSSLGIIPREIPVNSFNLRLRCLGGSSRVATGCVSNIVSRPGLKNFFKAVVPSFKTLGGGSGIVSESPSFRVSGIVSPSFRFNSLPAHNASDFSDAADEFRRTGSFEEAIVLYNKALLISPSSIRYRCNRGVCYYSLNKINAALEEFEISLRIDREFTITRSIYSKLLVRIGDLKGAKQCFGSIKVYIDPEEKEIFQLLQGLHKDVKGRRGTGSWEAAITSAKRAMNKGTDWCIKLYGVILEGSLALTKLEDAQLAYKQLMSFEHKHPNFCFGIPIEAYLLFLTSKYHQKFGSYAAAFDAAEKAVELAPIMSELSNQLGMVEVMKNFEEEGDTLFSERRYSEAHKVYDNALQLDPLNFKMLHNIARCFLKMKAINESVEFCSRAIKIWPRFQKAFFTRALCYEQMNRWDLVFEDYKKLSNILPGDVEVADLLQGAYRCMSTIQKKY